MRQLILFVLILALAISVSSARTWYIKADGSGDAPTIGAGVDSAAAGDTVLIAAGFYSEFDISIVSPMSICGETGDPLDVIVDGTAGYPHYRAIHIINVPGTVRIEGITIQNSHETEIPGGGAIGSSCDELILENCILKGNEVITFGGAIAHYGPHLRLSNCVFCDNSTATDGQENRGGGAVQFSGDHLSVSRCVFYRNTGGYIGGAIHVREGTAEIRNSTFYANRATLGGSVATEDFGTELYNTVIASSVEGEGVWGCVTLTCSNLYGNEGGDWIDCIADQHGINGNFSACPSFCHADEGDLNLCDESPCAPGNHPDGCDCGLIGAWPVNCACGPSTAESGTWGAIKAMYR